MTAAAPPPAGDGGGPAERGGAPVRDRRQCPWCWIPNYIVDEYGGQLGPSGLAVYLALARHAAGDQTCRPSYATLASETGMNRGTVIRVIPRLLALGLLQVELRGAENGDRRSNLYTLLDPSTPPPSAANGDTSGGGSGAARLPWSSGAPTPGAPDDHPSRLARLDPEQDPGDKTQGSEARAPQLPPIDQAQVGRLTALWLRLLSVRGAKLREDHAAEIGGEVAELLRLGWTADQLRAAIEEPGRQRWEWPREWRARVVARGRQPAQTPLNPAEVAQRAAQEAAERQKNAAEVAELLQGRTVEELMKGRRGAKPK